MKFYLFGKQMFLLMNLFSWHHDKDALPSCFEFRGVLLLMSEYCPE